MDKKEKNKTLKVENILILLFVIICIKMIVSLKRKYKSNLDEQKEINYG